jgi:oligopeptide transport system substrate-binding protein
MSKRILLFVCCFCAALGLSLGALAPAWPAEKVLRVNMNADPRTIDPSRTTEVSSALVIMNCFEGLMGFDPDGKLVPVAAESYKVSPDGLVYTFKLRKDGVWSNGDPVTAHDFVYAWKRVLEPGVGAEYASEMYIVKNGKQYNEGTVGDSELGIKALDDHTLQITLENPTGYFLSFTAMFFAMPENEKVVSQNEQWTLKGDTYVGNGPFKMTEWRPKESIVIQRNPLHRKASSVKLDRVEFRILTDPNSALATYESGDIDVLDGNIPAAMIPTLIADGQAKTVPYLATVRMQFNVSDNAMEYDAKQAKATLDPRVRRALALAVDRNVLVKNITRANERPATSFVPRGIIAPDGRDFVLEDYFDPAGDVTEAKKLLAEAGYPDGEGFPELTYIYGDFGVNGEIAQAVQAMLKTNLNVTLNLEPMEYGVMLDRRSSANRQYIMAFARWIADYVDPANFLEVFTYVSSKNYNNPKYEELIARAKTMTDQAARFDVLREAEAVLMGDMPVIPLYEMTSALMIRDYVKGYNKDIMGYLQFSEVDIVK